MDVDDVADARVQRRDHVGLALDGEAEVGDERLVEDRVDRLALRSRRGREHGGCGRGRRERSWSRVGRYGSLGPRSRSISVQESRAKCDLRPRMLRPRLTGAARCASAFEHALRGRGARAAAGRAAAAHARAGDRARRLARRRRRGLRAARGRGLPAHAPRRRDVRRPHHARARRARRDRAAATRAPPRYDLRPTLPALDGAFRPAWGRALNRALRTTPDARLGYPDPRGEPELRAVLAASLARRRGVQATPDDVRVTGGLGPSLPFVWRLLRERGRRRVAIEDPCWPRLPASLEQAGLEPVPLDGRRARHARRRAGDASTPPSSPPRTSSRPARSSRPSGAPR